MYFVTSSRILYVVRDISRPASVRCEEEQIQVHGQPRFTFFTRKMHKDYRLSQRAPFGGLVLAGQTLCNTLTILSFVTTINKETGFSAKIRRPTRRPLRTRRRMNWLRRRGDGSGREANWKVEEVAESRTRVSES